ncbi:hypothetical protein FSP39_011234 [Pinctada imbricata]|uniref:Uncharacterized protein n=1 Tax=Pinctada imbricata TaxID=66713 RepID=A0AA88YLH3_PINIB|nr:hypothetical protein FSP39_011234 [Pinctada imbricata]
MVAVAVVVVVVVIVMVVVVVVMVEEKKRWIYFMTIGHSCTGTWHTKQISDYSTTTFRWHGEYPFVTGSTCTVTLRPKYQPRKICFRVMTLRVNTYKVYARIYTNTATSVLRTYQLGSSLGQICQYASVAYLQFGTTSYAYPWEMVNTYIAIDVWAEPENYEGITVGVPAAIGGIIFMVIVVVVCIFLCKYRGRRRTGVTIVRPATQTVTKVEHHIQTPHPQQLPPHPGPQPLVHSQPGHFVHQHTHVNPIHHGPGHIQHPPPLPPSAPAMHPPQQTQFHKHNPIGFEDINGIPGPATYEAPFDSKGPPPISYPSPVK